MAESHVYLGHTWKWVSFLTSTPNFTSRTNLLSILVDIGKRSHLMPWWYPFDTPLRGVNHVTWSKLELGPWNSAGMANFSCWFQIWQPLSCRTKMKGRYSESCRITLHEENFFMREEMTMAYTFSRLIFYAEFKNDNLFDVRSKSKEPLIDYKMYTFLKWPKSWP